jgi:hypothetical protein
MTLQLARSGVSFVWRGPRRTATSHMISLGISRLVISKILNMPSQGVAAVYNRHSYDSKKRTALAKRAARLKEIIGVHIERSNVVNLATAG